MSSKKKRWDPLAKMYARSHLVKDYIRKPNVIDALGKVKGKKVLDLGCGSGYYSKSIAEKGGTVWGIDESKKQIELARELSPDLPINYVVGDASKMDFPENSFDLILSEMVFCHVSSKRKLFKIFNECFRILKKKGFLVFTMLHPLMLTGKNKTGVGAASFNTKNYFKIGSKYYTKYRTRKGNWVHFHAYNYSLSDYFNTLIDIGFSVSKIVEATPRGVPKNFKKLFSGEYSKPRVLLVKMQKP